MNIGCICCINIVGTQNQKATFKIFINACTQVFAIMCALTDFQAFLCGWYFDIYMGGMVKDIGRTVIKLTCILIIN